MFELSEKRVHAIVSGMMLSDDLKASWSQPTKTIVLHHVEPSSLQNAAMKFTGKISAFLESNEALLESRFFSYSNKYDKDAKGDDSQSRDGGKDRSTRYGNRRGPNQRSDEKTSEDDFSAYRSLGARPRYAQ